MKQILQNLRTGDTAIANVPCPALAPGQLLIRTTRSLVSAGTERMLVGFGNANLIEKARQQPEKVRMVLDKVKADGLGPTLQAVRNKLDQPLALGYCNVGRVLEVGRGVTGYDVGDRVASNGKHAEVVAVPVNLCAKVPDEVADEEAAFTVLGSIALQGIRLLQPSLGEAIAVCGLGLVGLLTVQLLRVHGCRVLGLDFDRHRLGLARAFGAHVVDLNEGADPLFAAEAFTQGNGIDGVIITASTKSSEPVHQAALMCRKRGRIVLIGVTGLELSRADFFEKELTFQVSCSYGPGRYDPNYELKGLDYPIGFVRWTEQRNFEAILILLAEGRLTIAPLISHRFPIAEAECAYAAVTKAESSMGILLTYPEAAQVPDNEVRESSVRLILHGAAAGKGGEKCGQVSVGVIGSGKYASSVLIPAFKKAGARLGAVASNTGISAFHAGQKFAFDVATTDIGTMLADETLDAIVISTPHDTHASLAIKALQAGKHVFVEKPLALTAEEVEAIDEAYRGATARGHSLCLMVGFNRRFSPHAVRMKALLSAHDGPKAIIMTINAGPTPKGHWIHDREIGGGRIIGEACHFVDLLRFLAGAPVVSYHLEPMTSEMGDTATILIRFRDGSIGAVHYLGNGNKSFPKERVEVFTGGRILQLDNFRKLSGFGWKGFRRMNLWRQDKGQSACVSEFLTSVAKGTPSPILYEDIIETSKVTIAVANGEIISC